MKKAGILDPHKVTKNALLNAASIAGTILLTECTIVDNPEDKERMTTNDGPFNDDVMQHRKRRI
jgi:chaperonin GroEL